jgi:NTE family protein
MQKKVKTGLVLSGGAIRGIAHLGVLKFLQEADMKPDIIAGASAGALVGAFYAAGYSAEESLAFFLKNKPITWRNYARRKPGILVFDRFAQSLAEQFPDDQFSALKKPLFITRTNLETGLGEIVHQGPLIKNLLASAAFQSFPGWLLFCFPPFLISCRAAFLLSALLLSCFPLFLLFCFSALLFFFFSALLLSCF